MPYYRRNLYVLSFTMFLASLSWTQIVPFLPLFVEELGAKGNALLFWTGLINSLPALSAIVAQPLWGKAADKFGRKPMVIRAGICLSGIYFGMSLCQTPLQLAVLRFMNGVLTGFIPGSIALIATNTPEKKAPRAVASSQAFMAAGQIAGPLIGFLLAAAFGYRGSMRLSGFAVLFSALLVLFLVKELKKPEITQPTSLVEDITISMKSPIILSVLFAVVFQGVFAGSINPTLPLHLRTMGNPPSWVRGAVFALPAAAFAISAYWWTCFGERRGFDRTILVGMAGVALSVTALRFVSNIWVFAAIYFASGVFAAAISPAAGALLSTRVHEEFRGRAYGMMFSANMAGATIAPLAASKVAAAFDIPTIYLFTGGVFLAGAMLFPVLARRWDKLDSTSSL